MIYIVIVHERHSDIDAVPFPDQDAANAYARSTAEHYARGPGDIEVWGNHELYSASWGSEGDHVFVVARQLENA